MRRTDSIIYALAIAVIAFAAVYLANPPAPHYNPVDGTWAMHQPKGVPSMGWYGRTAWALAGALAAAGITFAGCSLLGRNARGRPPAAITAMVTIVMLAVLFVTIYFLSVHDYHIWIEQ